MHGKDDFKIISKKRAFQSKGPKKNVKNGGKLKRTKRSREGESERQNLSGRPGKSFVRASQAILIFGNSTTSVILDRYAKFRIVWNR